MVGTKIKVVELFAGVGGFRVALEKSNYEIIWSNQWEPSTNVQHASKVYEARFGKDNHSNENINDVIKRNANEIPGHDLLVGGFPCQDYSVANKGEKNSAGLKGKKGKLWWSIINIIRQQKNKPKYVLFENVDRLLSMPKEERGLDFTYILQSLHKLGYAIEWRVINAADYGMPQRRKRVFFIGYHKTTEVYKQLTKANKIYWLTTKGMMAKAFPVKAVKPNTDITLNKNLFEIVNHINIQASPFLNTGLTVKGKIYTVKTLPKYEGKIAILRDVIQTEEVANKFYIPEKDIPKWEYLKGAKKEKRFTKDGIAYTFQQGAHAYPDRLDRPSRTIITKEGHQSPSRMTHVIQCTKGLRRLTPLELERLNMFPDNHTKINGITDVQRSFCIGNALVVGVVEKIGKELYKQVTNAERNKIIFSGLIVKH